MVDYFAIGVHMMTKEKRSIQIIPPVEKTKNQKYYILEWQYCKLFNYAMGNKAKRYSVSEEVYLQNSSII